MKYTKKALAKILVTIPVDLEQGTIVQANKHYDMRFCDEHFTQKVWKEMLGPEYEKCYAEYQQYKRSLK